MAQDQRGGRRRRAAPVSKWRWDYIIVGAGSAGCVVANRLSEDPDLQVLVLEAGGRDRSPYLRVPAGRLRMNDKYDWSYPSAPDSSRYGRQEPWESGKVLGGSSAINGMLWARGERRDFDDWASMGCEGWDFTSVLPYFRRSESFVGGPNKWRGGTGPQHVDFLRVHHDLTNAFAEAAKRAGYTANPDYNGASQKGVAPGQVTQRRGLRLNAARAYLAPVLRRTNLSVKTDVFVHRVLFERRRAVGVEFESRGVRSVARCEREVILSAGAIGSPKLLMLSGIGPRDELASVGVDRVVELPGVGKNLQNHPYVAMVYEVDMPTLNREFTPLNVLKGGLDLLFRGRGTATSAFGHLVLFDSLGGERIDYQAIFAPYGLFAAKENGRARHKRALLPTNAVTVRVGLMQSRARGQIRLQSGNPSDPPLVSHEFLGQRQDVVNLTEACRRVRNVMALEPMKSYVVQEMIPGEQVFDDAAWEDALRRLCDSGKHAAGTCKMGISADAVVDPNLRVLGTEALRVIDLSIAPIIPSANTAATAVMIGERGSDLVLSKI